MTEGLHVSKKTNVKKKTCNESDHQAHYPVSNCDHQWMSWKEYKNRGEKNYTCLSKIVSQLPTTSDSETSCSGETMSPLPKAQIFLHSVKPVLSLTVGNFQFLKQSSKTTGKCAPTKDFLYTALLTISTRWLKAEPSHLHCYL